MRSEGVLSALEVRRRKSEGLEKGELGEGSDALLSGVVGTTEGDRTRSGGGAMTFTERCRRFNWLWRSERVVAAVAQKDAS